MLDDPRTIADLKRKVLSFIHATDSAVARAAVKIIDVDYAMVCPTAAGGGSEKTARHLDTANRATP